MWGWSCWPPLQLSIGLGSSVRVGRTVAPVGSLVTTAVRQCSSPLRVRDAAAARGYHLASATSLGPPPGVLSFGPHTFGCPGGATARRDEPETRVHRRFQASQAVSVYLSDPDGSGVELYYDRPSERLAEERDRLGVTARVALVWLSRLSTAVAGPLVTSAPAARSSRPSVHQRVQHSYPSVAYLRHVVAAIAGGCSGTPELKGRWPRSRVTWIGPAAVNTKSGMSPSSFWARSFNASWPWVVASGSDQITSSA